MESNGTLPENTLSGKRIVITRSQGQGEDLRAELSRGAGAHVIELPCVEFRELEECREIFCPARSCAGIRFRATA